MNASGARPDIKPMIQYFCGFANEHHRQLIPLLRRLWDAGFKLGGVRPEGEENLNDHIYEMRDDVCAAMDRLSRYRISEQGFVRISLGDQTLARLLFDGDWRFELHLDIFGNPRADLATVQRRLLSEFEMDDLDTIIEVAAAFVDGVVGQAFGYELRAGAKPFLRARLNERRLNIELVNLLVYLRVLLFFMRKSDLSLFVRSPMELLRLMEDLQDFFHTMADTFEENDLTVELEAEKQVVYRCGKGVKPNLGSRFGPTAIQLDAFARIVAAAVRRGE